MAIPIMSENKNPEIEITAGGVITRNGNSDVRVELTQDYIRIGCSTISVPAALHIIKKWKEVYGVEKTNKVILQYGNT